MEKRVCQRAMEYEPPLTGVRAADDLQLWLLNGGGAGAAFVDAAQMLLTQDARRYHATTLVVQSPHLVAPLRVALEPGVEARATGPLDRFRVVLIGGGAALDAAPAAAALSEFVGALADVAEGLGAPLAAAVPRARHVDLQLTAPHSGMISATLFAAAAEQLAQARGLSARVLYFDPAAGPLHLGRGEGYDRAA